MTKSTHDGIMLRVLRPAERPGYLVCQCGCGTETTVRKDHVRSGAIRRCRACAVKAMGLRSQTHGQTCGRKLTRLYRIWNNMKTRCYNPRVPAYKDYGGRGIKVCARWHDYGAFAEDVGTPPSPRATLDRKDNNADYEPGNVRWTDPCTQANNRRSNVVLTHPETAESRTLAQWSRSFSCTRHAFLRFYYNNGADATVLTKILGHLTRFDDQPVVRLH